MKIDFDEEDFEVVENLKLELSPQEVSFIVHYGWLQKKSERSYLPTWSNRYFVLTNDGRMLYFTDNVTDIKRVPNGMHKGTIEIGDLFLLEYKRGDSGNGHGFYFNLDCINRVYELYIESKDDMESWMKYIALVRMNEISIKSDVVKVKSFPFKDYYKFENKFISNPLKRERERRPSKSLPDAPQSQGSSSNLGKAVPYTATSKEQKERKLPVTPQFPANNNKQSNFTQPTGTQPTAEKQNQPRPITPPKLKPKPLPTHFQPYICENPEKLEWNNSFAIRNMQFITFVRWCNDKMQRVGAKVGDITQFGDGNNVVLLVESLTGRRPPNVIYPASTMKDKFQNMKESLQFLQDELKFVFSTPHSYQTVLSGNMSAISGLIWDIIYLSSIKKLSYYGLSDRFALLRWVQEQLMTYKNIEVTNFGECWKDGMAFCALAHSVSSGVDYHDLQEYRVIQNLRLAFDTFYDRFQVPKLLEPNDVQDHHDEISIIVYLSICFEKIQ